MEAMNISFSAVNAVNSAKAQKVANDLQSEVKKDDTSENFVDTYSRSSDKVESSSGIYSKQSIRKTVEEIEEQRANAVTSMVQEMLGKQAESKGLKFLNDPNFKFTKEDVEEAKKSIEPDGYWSVDAVASRIMSMAQILAGKDGTKLDAIRTAIERGFSGAMGIMGKKSLSEMPDITQNTYTEVMKRFDTFSANFANIDSSSAE